MVDVAVSYPEGTRLAVAAEIVIPEKRRFATQLDVYLKAGFSRLVTPDGSFVQISDLLADEKNPPLSPDGYMLLVDRLAVAHDGDELSRLADSVETAFLKGVALPLCWFGLMMESYCTGFQADLKPMASLSLSLPSRCSISIIPTGLVRFVKGSGECRALMSVSWYLIRSGRYLMAQ